MPACYALCCPGFEDVVAGEVIERMPEALLAESGTGWVTFRTSGPTGLLIHLRAADAVGIWLGCIEGLEPGPDGLLQVEEWAASLDPRAALADAHAIGNLPPRPHFRVTGHRTGTHAYTSMELAAAAGSGLQRATGWPVRMKGFDLNIVLRVAGGRAMAGLALGEGDPEGGAPRAGGQTRLRRGVAHSLLRLLRLSEPRLVLDPMCGTGSIVLESAHLYPAARALGGDVDARALRIATERLRSASLVPELVQWDARAMPLRTGCVDGLVCNLPFGRRVGSHRRNQHLYPGFLRELYRVLRPGGHAVLLTLERRMTERLIGKHSGLRVAGIRVIELSGLHPSVYELEKLA